MKQRNTVGYNAALSHLSHPYSPIKPIVSCRKRGIASDEKGQVISLHSDGSRVFSPSEREACLTSMDIKQGSYRKPNTISI